MTACIAALLPAVAVGALVAIQGSVPECDAYARQLNTLFPSRPGNETSMYCVVTTAAVDATNPYYDKSVGLVAFGPNGTAAATRLAEYFEGTAPAVNVTSNWTSARVARVGTRSGHPSAECPCGPLFTCTGVVGNVSTCVPTPLDPPKVCFDGASATCKSLVAAGIGAVSGAAVGLASVFLLPQQ